MRRFFCLILRSSEGGLDTLLELMNALRISKDALNVKGTGCSGLIISDTILGGTVATMT